MSGYNTDRLHGLVFEARYILVLKIRVHKQCHVNTFRIGTSACMLWNHRHVQSPSQSQRALHWRAAFLHVEGALLLAAVSDPISTLIHCPLYMFLQSCLRWRDELHIAVPCEEFPPGLVNVCACHAVQGTAAVAPQWVLAVSLHAVFLPRLAKLDTVSHPVRAWNIGSAQAFPRPNPGAISRAARYRKLWPVPKASHSLSSDCNSCARDTDSTTTSVSTVRISIAWCPCWAAWDACSNIRVSASSWLYGTSEVRSGRTGLLSTASPFIMTSCLSSWLNHSMRAAESNRNSSVFLLL